MQNSLCRRATLRKTGFIDKDSDSLPSTKMRWKSSDLGGSNLDPEIAEKPQENQSQDPKESADLKRLCISRLRYVSILASLREEERHQERGKDRETLVATFHISTFTRSFHNLFFQFWAFIRGLFLQRERQEHTHSYGHYSLDSRVNVMLLLSRGLLVTTNTGVNY